MSNETEAAIVVINYAQNKTEDLMKSFAKSTSLWRDLCYISTNLSGAKSLLNRDSTKEQ